MITHDDLLFALDSTENGVVMTDTKGIITYANMAFNKVYGYEKDKALGVNMSRFKSGTHSAEFYKNLWDTITSGETWEGEICNKTLGGKLIWEQTRISPIRNKQSIIHGYIAVKENTTYKRELEMQIAEEQLLLSELFSNTPLGITICQPVLKGDEICDILVLKSNPTASTILNKLGIVGLTFKKLFPSFLSEVNYYAKMPNEKINFETYLPELDKYLSFKTFPLQDKRFCVIYIDVTNYNQTIKALIKSEQRYSSLVEDSPALICRFNPQGNIVYANSLFLSIFGQKDLLGYTFYKLFTSEMKESVEEITKSLNNLNPQKSFENRVDLDKKIKWHKWIIRALFDKNNYIYEYQALGIDFTEIKVAETVITENRNKLNTVVSNSIIGVAILDKQGYYTMVNERLCEMLGYSESELLNLSTHTITHRDDIELSKTMLEHLINKDVPQCTIEKRFIRKDGTPFWANLYVSPVINQNGSISQVVSLVADTNEKKIIEMQILENEYNLKKLNNTKDKLFSIIAHDIKNPFHAILGLSAILHDNLSDYSSDEIRYFVGRILEAGENTYKLLDDLLTWGRSQLGKLKATPGNVSPNIIVDEVFHTYRAMSAGKEITLLNLIPVEVMVWVDYDMLKFILRNLIHNGLKFTPLNGSVTCISTIDTSNNTVSISIKDTGIGIKPEKLSILFDINAFISTVGTSDEKGTGLGLSLTYEMLELNNGTIKVESVENQGTTFTITLPLGQNR